MATNRKIAVALGIAGITIEVIAIALLGSKRISTTLGTPLVIAGMVLALVPMFVLARNAKRCLAFVTMLAFATVAGADQPLVHRLDRLETLARVWARYYLFHPAIVAEGLPWEKALAEAIPAVEAAQTEEEVVAALQRTLVARVGDEEFRVFRKGAAAPAPLTPTGTIDARILAPGVGLIAMRDPNVTADPKFLENFAAAYRGLGAIKKLVVDLRWPDAQHVAGSNPDVIPRFFVAAPSVMGGVVKRQHTGWSERSDPNVYHQDWVVQGGTRLDPITIRGPFDRDYPDTKVDTLPIIKTPTMFVVNNHSHFALAWALDTLQRDHGAAVAWEKRGVTPRSPWLTGTVAIGKNHEFYIADALLLNASGGLGTRADHQTADEIKDLAGLAAKLLPRKAPANTTPFSFTMKFPLRDPAGDTISREQRIAGLIKIWAIVNRFDPHIKLASAGWYQLLQDGILPVEAAQTAREYYETLRRLTAPLNDSHVGVSHPSLPSSRATVPIELRPVEGKVLVARVADGVEGIQQHDEILAVDGVSVAEIERTQGAMMSLSTPATLQRNLWTRGRALWGPKGTVVRLTIDRNGKPGEVELPRIENPKFPPPAAAYRKLEDNVGYINLFEIEDMTALDRALVELASTRALILDIRGYPKFWITRDLTARLVDRREYSTKFVIPVIDTADENQQTWTTSQYVVDPHETVRYLKPVAVLINENTQSMAEDFCIYLRNAKRAIFVGSQTAGTNGNISTIDLPAGGRMTFTAMRVLYGDGSPFQNIGILPDTEVRPTLAGVRAGRDEVLERAIVAITPVLQ